MAKHPAPPIATDNEVRLLLERHKCPIPFHEVRTRFLGNIASPALEVSPIKMVESLWGGELPEFDSIDAANELIGALVMGLWNRLSRHQDRSAPFRLTRTETGATREGVGAMALMRRQELDGFVEGLFGAQDSVNLPERAHRGLNVLGEMRALIAGVATVAKDESKAVSDKDVEGTFRQIREMTRIAEHEIHAVILSCRRARRQMVASLPAKKPTLH